MATLEVLKETAVEYGAAMRLLVTNPAQFFQDETALPDYRAKLIFALPAAIVYAVGTGVIQHNPLWIPFCLVACYVQIGVWTVTLKYVLLPFGENRSFLEVLHIAVCAAVALCVAWVPVVGAPLAAILSGLWSVFGLVFRFKMHGGAAVAAVALPVVVTGFASVFLSFIFMALASLSSIFGS